MESLINDLKEMSNHDLNHLVTSRLMVIDDEGKETSHEVFITHLKMRNIAGFELGRRKGWWQDFDLNGPIPFPIQINKEDFEGQTMAHVMASVGHFKSVNEAKKNGWDKPIEVGIFKVGKKRKVEIK